jgi:hypothetical protein
MVKLLMSEQMLLDGPVIFYRITIYLIASTLVAFQKYRYCQTEKQIDSKTCADPDPLCTVTRMACSSMTPHNIPKMVSSFNHLGRRNVFRKGFQALATQIAAQRSRHRHRHRHRHPHSTFSSFGPIRLTTLPALGFGPEQTP